VSKIVFFINICFCIAILATPPFILLADHSSGGCSGNNSNDRDCDGITNSYGCGQGGRPCSRDDDLDDNDPSVGSFCSNSPTC